MSKFLFYKLTSRKFLFVLLGIVGTMSTAVANEISPEKAVSVSTVLTVAYVVMEGVRDIVLAWKGEAGMKSETKAGEQ